MKRLAYLSGALRVSTDPGAVMGGPRSHVLGMIGGFEAAGWSVDRYIAGDRAWAQRLAGGNSESTVRAATWRATVADGVRIAAGAWNAVAVRRAARVPAPDLVYERFASYQALGRQVQRPGTPWVLETSGPFFHEAKVERGTLAFDRLARRRELGAYRSCDLLVCVSEPLRDFLEGEGVPSSQMFVLPNGVDTHRFRPRPTRDAGTRLRIGFVGTVQSWQGLDLLVEAAAIARSRGVDVGVQVVGAGSGLDAVRAKVAERSMHEIVELVGQVPGDRIPDLIAGFDLGFAGHVPILDGSMYHSPLKLYEYMAMGKPVLASAYPDAIGLVERSGHGYLFEPGSVDALVAAIERAAGEIDRIRAAGPALTADICAHDSWDRRVADLLAELDRRGLQR